MEKIFLPVNLKRVNAALMPCSRVFEHDSRSRRVFETEKRGLGPSLRFICVYQT